MKNEYFEVRGIDGKPLDEPPHLWPTVPLAWKFLAYRKGGAGESVGEAIERLRQEGFTVVRVKKIDA